MDRPYNPSFNGVSYELVAIASIKGVSKYQIQPSPSIFG